MNHRHVLIPIHTKNVVQFDAIHLQQKQNENQVVASVLEWHSEEVQQMEGADDQYKLEFKLEGDTK